MKVALVGAELEENLALRYMASALESEGHETAIVPFNTQHDIAAVVEAVDRLEPGIAGLSMVFTSRAREFCALARALREAGYGGHIVAGGHFAALNCQRLLHDFPAFDSVGLGEGEEIICALARHLDDPSAVAGLCYRRADGSLGLNPSTGNPDKLDALPFPKRTEFHAYFDIPIASILSSRGCWRNCAFCSINAWYKSGGGKKFRIRSVENIVAEMSQLYFEHGIRAFNFQDDNFFLPDPARALARFEALREGLHEAGVDQIAIAIKARPDSITRETVRVLDDLGLFRVFLGVENASENGLRNLNRLCSVQQVLDGLRILNEFDVHIAYNLLMFEPHTTMDDILTNLHFMEKHVENPCNFCRAEAYAGTGLEETLIAEGRLLGDYFGFDYRLHDPRSEAFHQVANHAFFDRNFSDLGLHYFNMQVDFFYQLLRRFYPEVLTQTVRAAVRNFIKHTNLDSYECLAQIYDFVVRADPADQLMLQGFAREMRQEVDRRSSLLFDDGERLIQWLTNLYERRGEEPSAAPQPYPIPLGLPRQAGAGLPARQTSPMPYRGPQSLDEAGPEWAGTGRYALPDLFGIAPGAVPYETFRKALAQQNEEGR